VQVNVRRPRGDDIQAACGQLQGEAVDAVARREMIAVEALP
jgi:adenine C2-methylase RlmN of 23S rRNA A2503 and tRNA A37